MSELHWWLPISVEIALAVWGYVRARRGARWGAWLLGVAGYLATAPLALMGILFFVEGAGGMTLRYLLMAVGGVLVCLPVLLLPSAVMRSEGLPFGCGRIVMGVVLLATSWVGGYAVLLLHLVLTYPLTR